MIPVLCYSPWFLKLPGFNNEVSWASLDRWSTSSNDTGKSFILNTERLGYLALKIWTIVIGSVGWRWSLMAFFLQQILAGRLWSDNLKFAIYRHFPVSCLTCLFLDAMIRELRIACTIAQMEHKGGISPQMLPLEQVWFLYNLRFCPSRSWCRSIYSQVQYWRV